MPPKLTFIDQGFSEPGTRDDRSESIQTTQVGEAFSPTGLSSNRAVDFQCTTLIELLSHRARMQSTEVAYKFLSRGENETNSLTYQDLDNRAKAIAAYLQSFNLIGERASSLGVADLRDESVGKRHIFEFQVMN